MATTPLDPPFQELDRQFDSLVLKETAVSGIQTSPDMLSPINAESQTSSADGHAAPSKWKSALEDARHFAGGLISHPYESTKHYSILRHSHGLVYYKGSFTNLAITIFADRPLPEDRTLWLQKRGWSGKTGLRAGALLGTKSAWINVTPTIIATADQLPASDERAWQRDIRKFLDKAPKDLRHHEARETNVLRIPCQAEDGYLRVVLCMGEKGKRVLCPSPVFRLASTSKSASSIRGASLSTLPMELGLKAASSVAKIASSNAISPLTGAIGGQVSQYSPGFATQQAASLAYDAAGVQNKINHVSQQYDTATYGPYQQTGMATYDELSRPDLVGDDSGPESPYPVRFTGKVVQGSGRSRAQLGMPTANISGVPEEVMLRYKGVYLGWAQITPKEKDSSINIPPDWLQSIILFSSSTDHNLKVLHRTTVCLYIIHDFQGVSFVNSKVSIMVMGFLRPETSIDTKASESDIDTELYNIYRDVAITQASLSRLQWAAEETLSRVKSATSSRSLTERYVDIKNAGQNHVNRVPLHKAGIRTNTAGLRDRLVGNGGVCVRR